MTPHRSLMIAMAAWFVILALVEGTVANFIFAALGAVFIFLAAVR